MADIKFQDNTMQIMSEIEQEAVNWLEEASGEIINRTVKKSRRRTGQTAGEWDHVIDKSKLTSTIGNPMENALWEEYGTGEYALYGNGRRGGWFYKDKVTGKWHHTYGKKPNRAFHNSFKELEKPLQTMAQNFYRRLSGGK